MVKEETPAQAVFGNEDTITQVQVTGCNLVTNHSGRQQQSTVSARGDRSRRNNKVVFDTQYKDLDASTPDIGAV